ncbi:MAG: redox-regulated ATPase YchF [Patescibacteria group bacterium]
MNISVGIVGLPNVGKSTLFNALTEKAVPAENYPFCTIDPSVGIVAVPDPRLQVLSTLSGSEKIIPAAIEFVDIAGLVRGASEGAGLGNQFLSHIREVDAIAHVVRLFEDADITHVEEGQVDPLRDVGIINLELILADLQTVTKRIATLERDVKQGKKEAVLEQEALVKVKATLDQGLLARQAPLTETDHAALITVHLLTMKPMMYVLNRKAGGHNLDEMNDERWHNLKHFFNESTASYVTVDAAIEGELRDVSHEEKESLRREFGVLDNGVDELIREAYTLLGLMSYFTTGEKETRAWTVQIGSTAPVAGAAIHSDFRDKFIRAEVVAYTDLVEAGSFAKAREKGRVRTEGKEYVVKDGDVIEFKV